MYHHLPTQNAPEAEQCVFCLGHNSLDREYIGKMEFLHHATCLYKFKLVSSVIYMLIIVCGLLAYVSLDLPNYNQTLFVFGLSYLFTTGTTYIICANGDTRAYYMGGAIPTVFNHIILLGTSCVSLYDSSVISPSVVTYIFMGFAWSIIAYIIMSGLIGLGLFIPIIIIRNICSCWRYGKKYMKYGKSTSGGGGSISDESDNAGIRETILPTSHSVPSVNSRTQSVNSNTSVNGSAGSEFLNTRTNRFSDDGVF